MLQVFDRVLASRSEETLLVLTVAAVGALGAMALLDLVRARLLAAAGIGLERLLGPRALEALLSHEARLCRARAAQAPADAQALRAFLTGSGVLAIFDAPWLPIFLLLIALFIPLLGAMALGGAVLMVVLAVLNERLSRAPLARAHAAARRGARFVEAAARNTEVVSALGMLPALAARWQRLTTATLAEQLQASRWRAASLPRASSRAS
jgi:ABC-type protease/lipase transport system fused ATPase/permease subunit